MPQEIPQKSDVVARVSYQDDSGLGTHSAGSTRTPSSRTPKQDSVYNSATPTSTAQDVSTTMSVEACNADPVAAEMRMSRDERLAWRNKAAQAAKPNTDTSLPGFEAGEIEED